MGKWEYCTVFLGWTGGLGKSNKFVGYATYYSAKGQGFEQIASRDEELRTDIQKSKENVVAAIGRIAAYLGQQGWELVSLNQRLLQGSSVSEGEALLKRQISD